MTSVSCERAVNLPAPAREVWRFFSRDGALERMLPPWQRTRVVRSGPLVEGGRVALELGAARFTTRTVHEHFNVVPGASFCDRQVTGPFRHFVHRHTIAALGSGSRLTDRVELVLPCGATGHRLLGARVARELERALDYRHRVLAADLERQAPFSTRPRLVVAISGSSGTIGGALHAFLAADGHRVLRLVRHDRMPEADEVRLGARGEVVDLDRLEGVDAVIHLAGETIGRRFTRAHRARILRSRVGRTLALTTSLSRLERPPHSFFSASAVGFYGSETESETDEDGVPGTGFLAEVCRRWEEAAQTAGSFGARTGLLRFGLVLSPRGGALKAMLPAARCGLGGRLGHGRQMVSWIALDDALYAIHHLLFHPEQAGAFNLTAPAPVTQVEFARTLGTVLSRPAFLGAPRPLLIAALGRMARETLLASTSVVPERLLRSGFVFSYPDLERTLRHLLATGAGQTAGELG